MVSQTLSRTGSEALYGVILVCGLNGMAPKERMMKCDGCKNQHAESASMDYPYSYVYCAKGHWDGLGIDDDDDSDDDDSDKDDDGSES